MAQTGASSQDASVIKVKRTTAASAGGEAAEGPDGLLYSHSVAVAFHPVEEFDEISEAVTDAAAQGSCR